MLWLIAPYALQSALEIDYRSRSGLHLSSQAIPIVRGSTFQYYEPDWSKGYYSASYNDQKVERLSPDSLQMTFRSPDGQAEGSGKFTRTGNRVQVEYEFGWHGQKPVNVELMAAFLWAPALQAGSVQSESGIKSALLPRAFRATNDLEERRFGPDSGRFDFDVPIARLSLTSSSHKFTLFDSRGYGQDFARGNELLWYGLLAIRVNPGKTEKVAFTIDYQPKSTRVALTDIPTAKTQELPLAESPPTRPHLPLPKPQVSNLDWKNPVIVDSFGFSGQSVKAGYQEVLESTIKRRIRWKPKAGRSIPIHFRGLINPVKLGGFEIQIEPGKIVVDGDGLMGSRQAMHLLGQLATVKDGSLVLPRGRIESRPATQWRGVHLFVGPTALEFHKKLWTNVLLPMGFNKVVLQCERTEWESLPNVRGGIVMQRSDLSKLCDWYRSVGVEPIPLVQSFGHAEWLFQGGANRELAFNPAALYAIDPRKPGVAPLFDKLWAEVIGVTKAKTIHFGLDEVDMVGFPNDPKLVTDLWKLQLPRLIQIANRHRVQMMLWGDKGLAPGEAVDAALGDDPENAAARRAAIPVGAFVADWHYKAETDPAPFMKALLLWEREGFQPIASTWYTPANIRGFVLAAVSHGFGTLQTTWAGYESSEAGMHRHFEQFHAFVLAGDYAWSGREDLPEKTGYLPASVFQQWMYGRPKPMTPQRGQSVLLGPSQSKIEIDGVKFNLHQPQSTGSRLLAQSVRTIELKSNWRAQRIHLAMDCRFRGDSAAQIADVIVETSAGVRTQPVWYGADLRAASDKEPTSRAPSHNGLSMISIELGGTPVKIQRVRIVPRNDLCGVRVHGITLL